MNLYPVVEFLLPQRKITPTPLRSPFLGCPTKMVDFGRFTVSRFATRPLLSLLELLKLPRIALNLGVLGCGSWVDV